MAGLCAALASARRGARTTLVHDRPVLGGNASSEIRMWICGAHGGHNKEAGLLEEIQLDNLHRNPSGNYSIWDSVLWANAALQKNLTLLLNCSCNDATMAPPAADGTRRIQSIRAWQLTSQTWHTINARTFIDCSGDSILAPLTGADFRVGREARDEHQEDIEPQVGDKRTMGNSLLIQIRRTDEPQPFVAPQWAYKFETPDDLPNRINGVQGTNFWWLEVGGLHDTIADAEGIRDDLMRVAWGVWDHIKNRSPKRDEATNWALEWLGSLPGKRENRRYLGDHILTQNDVTAGGIFDDVVAYGGWSMDDHHPAGIYYPGKPTIFHPAPSPYGIPYRSLYSRNVANLMMAGRNISVTHAALSSTRVMATCAIIGQAAGTAAALCARHGCTPRELYPSRIAQLQQALMDDDCWLPSISRPISKLALAATLTSTGRDEALLLDGLDRDRPDESHAWVGPVGASAGQIEYRWAQPIAIAGVRLVLDSNLQHTKRMPCSYPQKGDRCAMPGSLLKHFRIESLDDRGQWQPVAEVRENHQRLVRLPFSARTTGLRLTALETWGDDVARVFAFEPVDGFDVDMTPPVQGLTFAEARATIAPRDLAPPAKDDEKPATRRTISA